MNIILESKNIFKSYHSNKKLKLEVLKDISLSVEKNKVSVIVGASGAGKSTLLHILSGLDRPDSGEVFFESENIFKYSDEKLAHFRNKNIGFVFQFHHLLPEFTAAENVAIPKLASGVKLNKALKYAEELLELVGIYDRRDHKPAELSGGEQQRVAVARALVNDPKIIFADEPTGNLDSKNSESIHQLILRLRDEYKKTFVIVTHNPELMQLADRIFEIKDGRLTK
ncbi:MULTISPECIES: ABC transporter ATP-binding protein [Ignavibacterium]|uniref:ABC transporter ATP-binding protein n=1 Tax=Ignavibacterium TaxID=795750 RepID=UPI0025C72606|nr:MULTISPECIES: ABC transporter ATP-binding protein [Ignavibacterium]MBI5661448.1 ABC transporter ATP-binding protein [Ignavibacterium album]